MDGGEVYGVGKKGKVMDYGTIVRDMDSLQYMPLEHVKKITLYVLEHNDIVEKTMNPDLLDELVHYDTHQDYVIKEFMNPTVVQKALGHSKKGFMMRELDGFRSILPLVKTHKIIGMPYKKTILFGFEIDTRCFVVNRKCDQVMSESIVNSFTEKQFVTFVEDILKVLIDIQKYEMAHGDIKLDNIMKCGNKYELIDWENCRKLDYSFLTQHRYLGSSPFYYKLLYGPGWYPAFKVALLNYYRETGGYDTPLTSAYADSMIEYYELFKGTMEETFDKVKYSLDLCSLGFILYGIMLRNPTIKKHYGFIMSIYKLKNAKVALELFKSKKTRKNIFIGYAKMSKRVTQKV